jgi:hypothetical protein
MLLLGILIGQYYFRALYRVHCHTIAESTPEIIKASYQKALSG